MEAFVFSAVKQCAIQYKIDDDLLSYWKTASATCQVHEFEKYMILRKLLKSAKDRGITLVVFKGCILANLYPNYTYRLSSDTDIFVEEHDKVKAIQ